MSGEDWRAAWLPRFAGSMQRYASLGQRLTELSALDNSLDAALMDRGRQRAPLPSGESADDAMFLLWLRARSIQQMSHLAGEVREAVAVCSSPLERTMLFALGIVACDLISDVYYRVDGRAIHGPRSTDYTEVETLCIAPQAQVARYRVDFLLTLSGASAGFVGDPDNHSRQSERQLIVECDGHAYHERSKEQAQHDRERDRAVQALGIPVFRFTGSEIWADVFGCAYESVRTLYNTVFVTDMKVSGGYGKDFGCAVE